MERNPFLIQTYVSPKYFCDRKEETAEIVRKLTNGNNVLLMSPRRMGKTGLIEHCFYRKALNQHYYLFYIDIYATNSLQEFVYMMGKAIFDKLKPRGQKVLEGFFSVISSLRPAFRLDEQSGQPIFDIGVGEIKSPEYSIEEIFDYLHQADKPCIIAIDEFQQIAKYSQNNVEAILRTHIQKASNCTFLFAGSQHHLLRNIFFTASRPFYQSVSVLSLKPIDRDVYVHFVINHFSQQEKKISHDVAAMVYDAFEGHTFYLQSIFNELYSLLDEDEECTVNMLQKAVKRKIKSFETIYQDTLILLSQRQKEVLCAIAKARKATNINSIEFVSKYGLNSPSSVQSAVKHLIEKELIVVDNNVYQVCDRFFGMWLSTVFGNGYKLFN